MTAIVGADALAADVRRGLARRPRELPPRWLYDERGSELFDAITRLEEYYPTRREREILAARAGEIARRTDADVLVEIGSGTSDKTRILLDALNDAGSLRRYVPFDVSPDTLHAAAARLAAAYPGIDIAPVVGDFHDGLDRLPRHGRRLIAFLGGTIGNLYPRERARLLQGIRAAAGPGGHLVLGADLVKDRARLEAAYNDQAGVTAAFNRNVLAVLNRELGADFDLDAFAHVARWDAGRSWMEIGLAAHDRQVVRIPAVDMEVVFEAGELLRTEISAKFRREGLERELRAAGLEPVAFLTDPAGDFAVSLARAE